MIDDTKFAVVRWYVLETGKAVYSDPMPLQAAWRVRKISTKRYSLGSVLEEGTPEFEAAMMERRIAGGR